MYNKFQREKDPHQAMGIGKRALIEKWLEEMEITNWHINDDLTIDVYNNVYIYHIGNMNQLPDFIQFGVVESYFACPNSEILSLRGFPKKTGNFYFNFSKGGFTKEDIRKVCQVEGDILDYA